METSPEIKNIAKALGQFQVDIESIAKDSVNPFFKSKYASFEKIVETIRPTMGKVGLSFMQFPDGDGLTTIVMHPSGEWIKATAKLIVKEQTPQGLGSAITYMRRYALSAALGLATEDDDDGNGHSTPSVGSKSAPGAKKYEYPTHTSKNDASGLPEAPSEAKIKAAKDRIMRNLKALGHEVKTREQVASAVSFELDVDISEAKDLASLEAIGEQLAEKASKKK